MFLCFDCIYRNVVWFVGVNKLIYFILWIWRFVVDIIEERLNFVIKDDIKMFYKVINLVSYKVWIRLLMN